MKHSFFYALCLFSYHSFFAQDYVKKLTDISHQIDAIQKQLGTTNPPVEQLKNDAKSLQSKLDQLATAPSNNPFFKDAHQDVDKKLQEVLYQINMKCIEKQVTDNPFEEQSKLALLCMKRHSYFQFNRNTNDPQLNALVTAQLNQFKVAIQSYIKQIPQFAVQIKNIVSVINSTDIKTVPQAVSEITKQPETVSFEMLKNKGRSVIESASSTFDSLTLQVKNALESAQKNIPMIEQVAPKKPEIGYVPTQQKTAEKNIIQRTPALSLITNVMQRIHKSLTLLAKYQEQLALFEFLTINSFLSDHTVAFYKGMFAYLENQLITASKTVVKTYETLTDTNEQFLYYHLAVNPVLLQFHLIQYSINQSYTQAPHDQDEIKKIWHTCKQPERSTIFKSQQTRTEVIQLLDRKITQANTNSIEDIMILYSLCNMIKSAETNSTVIQSIEQKLNQKIENVLRNHYLILQNIPAKIKRHIECNATLEPVAHLLLKILYQTAPLLAFLNHEIEINEQNAEQGIADERLKKINKIVVKQQQDLLSAIDREEKIMDTRNQQKLPDSFITWQIKRIKRFVVHYMKLSRKSFQRV